MSTDESSTGVSGRLYRKIETSIRADKDDLVRSLIRLFPLSWFSLFILGSLGVLFVISLQTHTSNTVFVTSYTLDNYIKLISEPIYLNLLVSTVRIAAISGLVAVVLAYPAAYYIGVKVPERFQYPLIIGIIAPMWTLYIVRVYGWMTILGQDGPLAAVLGTFGIVGSNFTLLGTETAIVITIVQIWFPMALLPIYSSMGGMKTEYFQAAKDLGAPNRDIFRRVVLPLTLPSVVSGFLFVFLPSLGVYVIPLLMGGDQGFVIASAVASQFLTSYNWPFGAALAFVLVVIALIVLWILQQLVDLREAMGGFA